MPTITTTKGTYLIDNENECYAAHLLLELAQLKPNTRDIFRDLQIELHPDRMLRGKLKEKLMGFAGSGAEQQIIALQIADSVFKLATPQAMHSLIFLRFIAENINETMLSKNKDLLDKVKNANIATSAFPARAAAASAAPAKPAAEPDFVTDIPPRIARSAWPSRPYSEEAYKIAEQYKNDILNLYQQIVFELHLDYLQNAATRLFDAMFRPIPTVTCLAAVGREIFQVRENEFSAYLRRHNEWLNSFTRSNMDHGSAETMYHIATIFAFYFAEQDLYENPDKRREKRFNFYSLAFSNANEEIHNALRRETTNIEKKLNKKFTADEIAYLNRLDEIFIICVRQILCFTEPQAAWQQFVEQLMLCPTDKVWYHLKSPEGGAYYAAYFSRYDHNYIEHELFRKIKREIDKRDGKFEGTFLGYWDNIQQIYDQIDLYGNLPEQYSRLLAAMFDTDPSSDYMSSLTYNVVGKHWEPQSGFKLKFIRPITEKLRSCLGEWSNKEHDTFAALFGTLAAQQFYIAYQREVAARDRHRFDLDYYIQTYSNSGINGNWLLCGCGMGVKLANEKKMQELLAGGSLTEAEKDLIRALNVAYLRFARDVLCAKPIMECVEHLATRVNSVEVAAASSKLQDIVNAEKQPDGYYGVFVTLQAACQKTAHPHYSY
jgi:hypothetical protein